MCTDAAVEFMQIMFQLVKRYIIVNLLPYCILISLHYLWATLILHGLLIIKRILIEGVVSNFC